MSIEALAMAGADYTECKINIEMWERAGIEKPPAYLLAEEDLGGNCMDWGTNPDTWEFSGIEKVPEHLLAEEDALPDMVRGNTDAGNSEFRGCN